MANRRKLPITEELDFHYLLSLMPPLHNQPEFAWLPELFAIIGHDSLIKLCRYAGGETITIPTMSQLSDSIDALEAFYQINIDKSKSRETIPPNILPLYLKICEVYNARECENSTDEQQ